MFQRYYVESFRASRAETLGGKLLGVFSELYKKQIQNIWNINDIRSCVEKFSMIIMTFSYFPGMYENPAPVKYYLKIQNQKYYEILTIYECVEK